MYQNNKVRSRKDKLVPRDCEEFNVESEDEVEIPSVTQTVAKGISVSIEIEVLKDDEMSSRESEEAVKSISSSTYNTGVVHKYPGIRSQCSQAKRKKLSDTQHMLIATVSEESSSNSSTEPNVLKSTQDSLVFVPERSFSNKELVEELKMSLKTVSVKDQYHDNKIAMEIRTTIGLMAKTPQVLDKHDQLLQVVINKWKVVAENRYPGTKILAYTCWICSKMWWSFYPFSIHIKRHASLKLELSEGICDSFVVAYDKSYKPNADPMVNAYAKGLNGNCTICGLDLHAHNKHYKQERLCSCYICARFISWCPLNEAQMTAKCTLRACIPKFTIPLTHIQMKYECIQGIARVMKRNTEKKLVRIISVNTSDLTKVMAIKQGDLLALFRESSVKHRSCNICGVYIEVKIMNHHKQNAHTVRSDVPMCVDTYPCNMCGEWYTNYNHMINGRQPLHICSKLGLSHSCCYCYRCFPTKQLLASHMAGLKPIQCVLCKERLSKSCMEIEHLVRHSSIFMIAWLCNTCPELVVMVDPVHHRKKKSHGLKKRFFDKIVVAKSFFHVSQDKINGENEKSKSSVPKIVANDKIDEVEEIVDVKPDECITEVVESEVKSEVNEEANLIKEEPTEIDAMDIEEQIKRDVSTVSSYEQMLSNMFQDCAQQHESDNGEGIAADNVVDPREDTSDEEYEDDIFIWNTDHMKPVKQEVVELDDDDDHNIIDDDSVVVDDSKEIAVIEEQDEQEDDDHDVYIVETKPEVIEIDDEDDIKDDEDDIKDDEDDIKDDECDIKNDEDDIKDDEDDIKDDEDNINDDDIVEEIVKDDIPEKIQSENLLTEVEVKQEDINKSEIKTLAIETEIKEESSNVEANTAIESLYMENVVDEYLEIKEEPVEVMIEPDYHVNIESVRSLLKPKKRKKHVKIYFSCSKCDTDFLDIRGYVIHFPEHGISNQLCPFCLEFMVPSKLCQHIPTFHVRKMFIPVRMIEGQSKDDVYAEDVQYKCKQCSTLVFKYERFNHWERHTTLPENQEIKYVPDICHQERLETISDNKIKECIDFLKTDTRRKRTRDARCCVLCLKEFDRTTDVKRHVIEHLLKDALINRPANSGLKCQDCGSIFEKPYGFKQHMRVHASLGTYKCELCDKYFNDSSNFAKHKKVHNISVMVCDICTKKFHSRAMIERHMQIHEKTQTMTCTICGMVFKEQSQFTRHHRQVHMATYHTCSLCKEKFISTKDKWVHMWEIHRERKEIADCPTCNKQFRLYREVIQHVKAEHDPCYGRKRFWYDVVRKKKLVKKAND